MSEQIKQDAEELVNRFDGNKQYAIICCEEILKVIPDEIEYRSNDGGISDIPNPQKEHYTHLKHYIEKL